MRRQTTAEASREPDRDGEPGSHATVGAASDGEGGGCRSRWPAGGWRPRSRRRWGLVTPNASARAAMGRVRAVRSASGLTSHCDGVPCSSASPRLAASFSAPCVPPGFVPAAPTGRSRCADAQCSGGRGSARSVVARAAPERGPGGGGATPRVGTGYAHDAPDAVSATVHAAGASDRSRASSPARSQGGQPSCVPPTCRPRHVVLGSR